MKKSLTFLIEVLKMSLTVLQRKLLHSENLKLKYLPLKNKNKTKNNVNVVHKNRFIFEKHILSHRTKIRTSSISTVH